MSNGFCSKFHTLSSSVKILKNRLRFDKVTESLKVGTFLRHSVHSEKSDTKNIMYFAEGGGAYAPCMAASLLISVLQDNTSQPSK